jgi:hypothetical protein
MRGMSHQIGTARSEHSCACTVDDSAVDWNLDLLNRGRGRGREVDRRERGVS